MRWPGGEALAGEEAYSRVGQWVAARKGSRGRPGAASKPNCSLRLRKENTLSEKLILNGGRY